MIRNPSQYIILGFLGAFSGAILAGSLLFFIPKKYETSYEVARVLEVSDQSRLPQTRIETICFPTEMPPGWIFRNHNSLSAVSKRLELPARWNIDERQTLKRLKENVEVEVMEPSATFRVTIKGLSADESFEIASSLLEVNQERFQEFRADAIAKITRRFEQEIKTQSNQIANRSYLPSDEKALHSLQQEFENWKTQVAESGELLEVRKSPEHPMTFSHPDIARVLSIGAGSGLAAGLVMTFFFQRRQKKSKDLISEKH